MKEFKKWLLEMKAELDHVFHPQMIEAEMLKATDYQLDNGQEVKLELADEADIEEIMEIQKVCYGGKAPWKRLTVFSEMKKAQSFFLIVNHLSEGIAFVAVTIRKGHLHITNIGTKPAFQRQGLAAFLIENLIHLAPALAINRLTLEVRVSNDKAKNLYYKMGFKDRYVKEYYYSDNQEDALEMLYLIEADDEEKDD